VKNALRLLTLAPLLLAALACGQNPTQPPRGGEAPPDAANDADATTDADPTDLTDDAANDADATPDLPDDGPSPDLAADSDADATEDAAPDASPPCVPAPEVCDGLDNDCDGAADEPDEVNTESNPLHCGACGAACAFDGALGRCDAGRCVVDACPEGALDLDEDGANGCERRVGAPRVTGILPATPRRVIDMDLWYAVLDGEAVWLYVASTHELIDVEALPGALDAAWDRDRNLLAVVGGPAITILEADDAGLRHRASLEARGRAFQRALFVQHALYVGNDFNQTNDNALWVLDLTDPDAPSLAGKVATLRAASHLSLLRPDLLVAVSASTGLSLYDLRDPLRPTLRAFTTWQAWPALDLAIDPDRALAFVASRYNGLFTFDLSDPDAPRQLGQITDLTPGQSAQGLLLDQGSLWVTDLSSIRRFDLADPANPTRRVSQTLAGAGAMARLGHQVALLVLRSWSEPIRDYAINGGRVQTVTLGLNAATLSPEVYYDGAPQPALRRAFVMGDALVALDANGQALLYGPGTWLGPEPPLWQRYLGLHDAVLRGDRLHATAYSYQQPNTHADYVIFRLDDPAQGLVEERRVPFPCPQTGVTPYNLSLNADAAFVICGGYDSRVASAIDLSDPTDPRPLGLLDSPIPVYYLAATDQQLILAQQERFQFRDTARLAGHRLPNPDLRAPNWTWSPDFLPTALTLHRDTLYASLADGDLRVLDVGFRDAWSPLALPDKLPAPPSALSGPVTAGPLLLLPTEAGLTALRRRGPALLLASHLTRARLRPTSALLTQDALLLLEPRRAVWLPLTP
jgi:hypothetical protein